MIHPTAKLATTDVIATVFFLFTLVSVIALWPRTETAFLKCDESPISIGVVKQNTVKKHEFAIVNTSDIPLKIIRVDITCTCTNVIVSTSRLEPNGKATVGMEVSTGSRRGDFSSKVNVLYQQDKDGGKLESLPLVASCYIKPHYELNIKRIELDERHAFAKITIESNYDPPVMLKSAYSNNPAITVDTPRLDSPSHNLELSVTYNPEKRLNGFSDSFVKIETDSPYEPNYSIPIRILD